MFGHEFNSNLGQTETNKMEDIDMLEQLDEIDDSDEGTDLNDDQQYRRPVIYPSRATNLRD